MPIPSLPLDLVFEIISHLQEEKKIEQRIQEGKMVSLVCKSWKSLGQGLCWRKVEIELLRLPSLLGHFARFPHLAKLVRDCTLSGPRSESSDIIDISDKEALALLPQSLTTWVNLESLIIEGRMEEDLVSIIEAASYLENLNFLGLNETGDFNCSNEFIASFQSGFKKLSGLGFYVANSVRSSLQLAEQPANFRRLRIVELIVVWDIMPAEASRIARDFLSISNPTTLKEVVLIDHAACRSIIECLSGYPNILRLTLRLYSEENLDNLAQIFSILPQFSSLKRFEIQLPDIEEEYAIESPVSLSEIIACFSPSLRIFRAEQFVFPDFYQIPVRQAKLDRQSSDVKSISALRHLDAAGGGTTELLLWGEDEKGRVHWFREEQETVAAE